MLMMVSSFQCENELQNYTRRAKGNPVAVPEPGCGTVLKIVPSQESSSG